MLLQCAGSGSIIQEAQRAYELRKTLWQSRLFAKRTEESQTLLTGIKNYEVLSTALEYRAFVSFPG